MPIFKRGALIPITLRDFWESKAGPGDHYAFRAMMRALRRQWSGSALSE